VRRNLTLSTTTLPPARTPGPAAAQQHLPRRARPEPAPTVAIVQDPVQAAKRQCEACSTAVSASSYDQLTAAQPGSPTPLHIQQPVYDNGQLTVRMLILGVSVGSEETLYRVLWRRRVCIDSPGNGKLFQMTVVAERGYFQLTQLQFNCRYFVRLIPMDSPASKRRLRNITACFRTPSCDEVKLASGSPPPEQCPAALETQLPEPPGRIQVRQLAQTGSGNDLLSYLVTWTPAASAGTTASDSSTSHRRRRGRGTSISGYCVVWGPV
uniref:NTR domain-containing protein n=1 Tax=Macrostomum lignano TaxID=282301 RepID=A0A1I8HVM7_9PLAT